MELEKRLIRGGFFLVSCFLFTGCMMRLSDRTPPGPRHEAYQPINNAAARRFVFQALELAVAEFGEPVVPVETVYLRRSLKGPEAQRYLLAENFSETSCIDTTNGVFVIYMGADPDQGKFYGVLGHECAHLINAHVTDWYIEGVATVFSEQVCAKLGKEWGGWKRHFLRSRRDPYALSYRMMLELQAEFPAEYPTIIRFAVPREDFEDWFRIDIDAWIGCLPEERRRLAVEIIEPYVEVLQAHTGVQYDFVAPSPF